MKLKTPAIVAVSMAFGIVAGAGVSAIAGQPNMKSALDHLVVANAYLVKASDNKGGHKVKAMTLIKAAITEVKLGIAVGAM